VEPTLIVHAANLALTRSQKQQTALDQLLKDQRDPRSPHFRQWLTPDEFGERFGASSEDVERIASWLQSQGLTVDTKSHGRAWIEFSGRADRIENAFHTELHNYEIDGETHFANAGDISVPAAFAGVISGVRGLNDFLPKRLHTAKRISVDPQFTSGGGHSLAPDDLATIYNVQSLYNAGIDGTGQKLVIAGQTAINLTDVPAFRTYFHLATNDPQVVLYGVDPGIRNGDYLEAMLDLQWSGAVARNATILYVYSNDVFSSVMHAIDDDLAPVISVSYAACEQMAPVFQSVAQQGNAEGITWMNASGDGGAAACGSGYKPSVLLPADIPEVTAVGGTELADQTGGPWWASTNGQGGGSALGYIPEKAWSLSGGGVSEYYTKPSWQTGPGVPADGMRDLPDVALSASTYDPYLVYSDGWWSVGGTSASSPSFAGMVTLLNHYLVSKGIQTQPGVGNINPDLYQLAQTTPNAFHDITTGNNVAQTSNGMFGYQAGPGYDQVTGLGSVDAYNLVTQWSGQQQPSAPAPTSLVVMAAPAAMSTGGSTQITAIVSGSGSGSPAGTVTLSAGSIQLGSVAATAWGTSSMAKFVVNASSLAMGANTLTATYTSNNNFSASNASLPVTVTESIPAAINVVANPPSISTTGSSQLMMTIQPSAGSPPPIGTVTFLAGNVTLGTAHLMAYGPWATAAFLLNASQLQPGNNIITVTYPSTGGMSQTSVMVTVTGN
jgi:subtilase family serine protease